MGSSNREALDRIIASERQWLAIASLRFLSHPALAQVFPEYAISVYHAMRTAAAVMEAARLRSVALAHDCPVADRLVEYWTRHLREESGHDVWMWEDLSILGVDRERDLARPPIPEVAELLGTLHFWVLHTHPVAAVAYFYVLERSPPTVQQLDWMVESAGIPRDGLRTFYRHAVIDVAHGRELEELVDSLPLTEAHQQLLGLSAKTVVRQLARIMEKHVQRADQLLAADTVGTPGASPASFGASSTSTSDTSAGY